MDVCNYLLLDFLIIILKHLMNDLTPINPLSGAKLYCLLHSYYAHIYSSKVGHHPGMLLGTHQYITTSLPHCYEFLHKLNVPPKIHWYWITLSHHLSETWGLWVFFFSQTNDVIFLSFTLLEVFVSYLDAPMRSVTFLSQWSKQRHIHVVSVSHSRCRVVYRSSSWNVKIYFHKEKTEVLLFSISITSDDRIQLIETIRAKTGLKIIKIMLLIRHDLVMISSWSRVIISKIRITRRDDKQVYTAILWKTRVTLRNDNNSNKKTGKNNYL